MRKHGGGRKRKSSMTFLVGSGLTCTSKMLAVSSSATALRPFRLRLFAGHQGCFIVLTRAASPDPTPHDLAVSILNNLVQSTNKKEADEEDTQCAATLMTSR